MSKTKRTKQTKRVKKKGGCLGFNCRNNSAVVEPRVTSNTFRRRTQSRRWYEENKKKTQK